MDLPQWRGEDPPPGSGGMLRAEQGLDDSLRFVRYLPLLARRFQPLACHAQRPLMSLFQSIRPDNCEMHAIGPAYDTTGYHYQAPWMSLPLARFQPLLARPDPDRPLDPMGEVGDIADAGALARPVWLLERHASERRWMRGRQDSPRYPSLRLFNQPAADAWPTLLRQVNQALDTELARIAGRRVGPLR